MAKGWNSPTLGRLALLIGALWLLRALPAHAQNSLANSAARPPLNSGSTSGNVQRSKLPFRAPRSARNVQTTAWQGEATANEQRTPTGPPVDYALSGEQYAGERYAGELQPVTQRSRSNPPQQRGVSPVALWQEEPFLPNGPHAEEYDSANDPGQEYYADEPYADENLLGEECEECGEFISADEPHEHAWYKSFLPAEGHWFRTSKNSPPSIGWGEPLRGTSWMNRPNSVSFFAGVLNGDQLITGRVDQGSALFGGLRLGWDFDHYWGLEARGAWASPDLVYAPAQFVERVDGIFLCDASFLYYPWGDSAWRPYGLLGMGMSFFDFTDDIGQVHNEFLLGAPIGIGMKYMYHPNLVFRAEFLDNIAFGGSGINTMNNLSFTLGMEIRFGGKPRSYYPWQPAKYIW